MIDAEKMAGFKQWATKLHEEVSQRDQRPKDAASDTPASSSYGYLMMTAYEAFRRKMAADEIDSIKSIASALGQSAAGTKAENPAEWLLLASYAAVGPVDSAIRSKCKRLGLLLLYAQQQQVKPGRLIGRLYEDGGFTRINKLMRASNPDLFTRRKRAKKRPMSYAKKLQSRRAAKREQHLRRAQT